MLLSSHIVSMLGGPRKMAAALDRSESTIWRWLNESFSGSNLESVQALCRKKGIDASPNTIIAQSHEAPKNAKKQTSTTIARKRKAQRAKKAVRRKARKSTEKAKGGAS